MSAYEGVNPDREGRYTHTSINVPPCTCMNVLDHKLSRWTHVFWSEHTLMCVFTPENVQMDAICAVTSIPTQPCSSTCLYTTIDMSWSWDLHSGMHGDMGCAASCSEPSHWDPQHVKSVLEQGADSCFILSMPGGSNGEEELWEGQPGTSVLPCSLLKAPCRVIDSLSRSTSWCIWKLVLFIIERSFLRDVQFLLTPTSELMISLLWLDSLVGEDNLHGLMLKRGKADPVLELL